MKKPSEPGSYTPKACAAPGRPRAFDPDQALERAMQVFWRKGYEGASLADLTEAMGINRPSLYAAFGNKESLFRKVVERYNAGAGAPIGAALEEPTARGVLKRMLCATIEGLTTEGKPNKCLLMEGALACESLPNDLHQEVVSHLGSAQCALRVRLERGVAEGELPLNTNCADLARYFATVMQGMNIQAAAGASRAELEGIAETALRVWPG